MNVDHEPRGVFVLHADQNRASWYEDGSNRRKEVEIRFSWEICFSWEIHSEKGEPTHHPSVRVEVWDKFRNIDETIATVRDGVKAAGLRSE